MQTNDRWTRNSDGIWTRNGWTIRQTHMSGSGQTKPFAHVSKKSANVWNVYDPDGFLRTGAALLGNAKVNADRQIALRAQS